MSVYERHELSNGLRVVTADMPQVQSVTCMIMLAAGSRYETPDTNGIAHFAEHMFFKGTERRPTAREIGMEVDSLGAEFNAFTSKEYTGYYVKCAADYRDRALDVLVDMIRNSKFATEEIVGGHLPVSPFPFHAAFHAASFSRHSSGIATDSRFA